MILGKQKTKLARIHDLGKKIKRLTTLLSEAISANPVKNSRDMPTVRASLEKEYQQEITSLRQKLKSRFSHFESIRAPRDADAKT